MKNITWNIVGTLIVMEYAMWNIVGTLIVNEIQALFMPAGGGEGLRGSAHQYGQHFY